MKQQVKIKKTTNDIEEWKKVSGHDSYTVSNLGRIKSGTGKILDGKSLRGGYRSVTMDGKIYKLHRIIAKAFVENNDKNKNVVNHKDGNKLNNRVDNLEWVTTTENTAQGFITGKNKVTKRAVYQLDLKGRIMKEFESLKQAREQTGISDCGIANCCKDKKKTAGGYKWTFVHVNPNEGVLDLKGFKEVKGFPNYRISKDGIIYSIKFKKILKQQTNADGYKVITLVNNKKKNDNSLEERKKKKSFLIHRLVAEHFIKKIDGKDYVNHKDSNKINNNVKNLEWNTNSENVKHAAQAKKRKKMSLLLQKREQDIISFQQIHKMNVKMLSKQINNFKLLSQ